MSDFQYLDMMNCLKYDFELIMDIVNYKENYSIESIITMENILNDLNYRTIQARKKYIESELGIES